ncbi:hypothetical protein Emag_004743 [Eimeria magna]
MAAATAAASNGKPQQLNCIDHLQPMITRALNQEAQQQEQQEQQQQQQQQEQQQQRQRYRCSSAVADFPLSLVCRALFPLNPTLESRPRGLGGPPFFYEQIRPLRPRHSY